MGSFHSTVARVLSLLLAGAHAVTASAAPAFQIVPIGIDDAEHTFDSPYGYKDITAEQLNAAGHVIGHSRRAFGNGGSSTAPLTAWLYDGTATINIGLIGPEHTASDGYKYSSVRELNEAGQAIGTSSRHLGRNVDLGHTAWLYHNGSTIDIGLTDAEHTSAGGYKRSFAGQLNEAGQVIGESDRFNGGNSDLGNTAWLYDGANTINIGLTGAEYTRHDDFKNSVALQLTEAGHVRGRSLRYNVNIPLGQTVWLYNGTSTIPIGFTGTGYTRANGWKYSFSELMSESGKIAGYSERYTSDGYLGQTAWLYDGANTIEIGLVDAEHTALFGHKYSAARDMNDAGQVTGFSKRSVADVEDGGESAFLYNGTTTTNIGLTDAEHTGARGVRSSVGYQINEAGQVLGNALRYNGGASSSGESAWLYNGTTTVRLGLTDAQHTGLNAYQYTMADMLNEAGQVIGYSKRL